MKNNLGVCVLLCRATAADNNGEHEAGERRAIMAFSRADTIEAAKLRLEDVLADQGWRDFELERSKRVGLGAGADGAVRGALAGRVVIHDFSSPTETSG